MNTTPLEGVDVEVAEIQFGHDDQVRRAIWEANGKNFSVQHFFIHGGKRLGDHYHLKRDELFTVTKGTGKLYLQRAENGQLSGESTVVDLMPGVVVYIPPRVAHTFIFDYVEDETDVEILSEMWQYSHFPFSDEDTMRMPLAIAPEASQM